MEAVDTYLTVKGEAQAQFVEQRSRFISFIWHVATTDEVKERIAALQKEYYDARHVCYAYMLGTERTDWRANDNGEPSGTAGKPILGQINSARLSDVLIAVVRYFGGVKLGTSGLTEAYRLAAAQVIEKAEIVTAYVERDITVLFTYNMTNVVMKAVKDLEVRITSQDYGSFSADGAERPFECQAVLRARLSVADEFESRLKAVADTQAVRELKIENFWSSESHQVYLFGRIATKIMERSDIIEETKLYEDKKTNFWTGRSIDGHWCAVLRRSDKA